jgi:hypothetical protein
VLRCLEREPIVAGGTGQLRREAWASAKPVVIRAPVVRARLLVDDCKGAVALRGVRNFREGKALKGDPRNGCGTKQGREARVCQKTAERLRKPESGTGVGVTTYSMWGLLGGYR